MERTPNGKGPKAVILGLDGVPFTLLARYLELGILPNLAGILARGYRLEQMDASVPDVSSTSWTSFMTGVNPGEHGIYGFIELRPGTCKMHFPNFTDVQAPTIWDILGQRDNGRRSTLADRFRGSIRGERRSIVLNVPQTYPAAPLNGILTAGFVAPDLQKATYPDSAYRYLKSAGYVSDVDATRATGDTGAFLRELSDVLGKRREVFAHLMETEAWDLFIGTVTETDRLHHFFFDAAFDPGHPFHGAFLSLYRELDEMIGFLHGKFMERTDGNGLFMTLSDHGFTAIRQEFYLNQWLRQEGYLKTDPARRYFEQIDHGTRAFALDPGRIYIHAEGRYPLGTVKPGDRRKVMDEIRARLLAAEDGAGNRLVREVRENEELYRGPCSGMGPDLVCIPHDGYDVKGTLGKQTVLGKEQFTGMHTAHDAHCILPAGAGAGERLHIEGLAGRILEHFATS